jgi:DNA-directed RNA polymerase alpha subunit
MSLVIKKNAQNEFPTREELNFYCLCQMAIEATKSEKFNDYLIKYLKSKQIRCENTMLMDIKFSSTVKNILIKNGVHTLKDLTKLRISQVVKMEGIGRKNLKTIIKMMDEQDIYFDTYIEGLDNL